jgi:hypothetical protein
MIDLTNYMTTHDKESAIKLLKELDAKGELGMLILDPMRLMIIFKFLRQMRIILNKANITLDEKIHAISSGIDTIFNSTVPKAVMMTDSVKKLLEENNETLVMDLINSMREHMRANSTVH